MLYCLSHDPYSVFFFNDPPTTEIYTTTDTLSLHDALPIFDLDAEPQSIRDRYGFMPAFDPGRSEEHTSELQSPVVISYAVFCLKKKTVAKDEAQARKLFEKAAQAGNPRGVSNLAALGSAGGGAPADPAHFFLMIRQPPKSTQQPPLFPYTTLFR